MERVHSMFSNAFNTVAGELVEKATASSLATEDWGLNMQVCDTINSYSDGAKDAVKAIKRRLASNKSFNQISLTLSVLEACIKNCGLRFHKLVTTKEFILDILMKVIQPKYNPSVVLQQRVLGLIKQLAEAFGSNPAMSGVRHAYDELKDRRYEFPDTEPLEVYISKPDARPPDRSTNTHPPLSQQDSQNHQSSASVSSGQILNPNPQQMAKLRKDLSVVEGNIKVMSEMLTELNPHQCDPSDYELLQELNRTCRAMQQRIVELIGQVANEEITVDLLRINDDLNNLFLRYDRFERYRSNRETNKNHLDGDDALLNPLQAARSPLPPSFSEAHQEPPPSYSDTEQPTLVVNDLIDFGTDEPSIKMPTPQQSSSSYSLSKELGDINLTNRSPSHSNPASYPMLSEQLASFDKPPQEIEQLGSSKDEIEQWLSTDGSALGLQPVDVAASSATNENAVTDEFSAFLSERASASKNLPNVPPTSN